MRLRDWREGRIPGRDVYIVLRFPEPDSPLAHALATGDYWTTGQALAALLNDRLALLMWGLGGARGAPPKQLLGDGASNGALMEAKVMTLAEVDEMVLRVTGRDVSAE